MLLIVSVYSLGYLNSVYYDFPNSFPKSASEIFDIEMSFISSLRFGVNKFPRFYDTLNFIKYHKLLSNSSNEEIKNNFLESHEIKFSKNLNFSNSQNPFYYYFRFLFFNDPMRNGKTFICPSLPLIYIASLNELGMSYAESSVIVCFLNIIATVVGIFFLSHFFLSKTEISVVIVFLFSSGWSFLRFFSLRDYQSTFSRFDDFDLIHSFGKQRKSPFFSPILYLLSFSKHSSFSIPLSLFTLSFAHPSTITTHKTYILAGIFLLLNPSPAVSLSLIITLLFYSNSIKFILPFIISIIPKLIVFNDNFNINLSSVENNHQRYSSSLSEAMSLLIKFKPIWKEYQLHGIFYSQLLVLFDSFGFLFFFLILSPFLLYMINSPIFTQRFIASSTSFIIFSLIRVGNDYYENAIVTTSVFLPFLSFLFSNTFNFLVNVFDNSNKSNSKSSSVPFFNFLLNFFINRKNCRSKQFKGFLKAIKFTFVLSSVLGTFCSAYVVSGFKIEQLIPMKTNEANENTNKNSFFVSVDDFNFADFLKKSEIHPREPIFCLPKLFNPITALCGRPVISGNFHELWKRGADINEEVEIFNLINQSENKYDVMKRLGYKYLLEIASDPFVVVNSSVGSLFDVLYKNDQYIFMKIRENK